MSKRKKSNIIALNKSYNGGFRCGKHNFRNSFRENGTTGIAMCDKAAKTCLKYATDMRVTKTAKGKPLTQSLRDWYKGMADGFLAGYNDLNK